jgi:hypothetical protein
VKFFTPTEFRIIKAIFTAWVTDLMTISVLMVVYVTILPEFIYADAQDKAKPTSEEKAFSEFLVRALESNRDLLRSGSYTAKGIMIDEMQGKGAELSGEFEVFCSFDFDKQLYRFDRKVPALKVWNLPPGPPIPASNFRHVVLKEKWACNRESTMVWRSWAPSQVNVSSAEVLWGHEKGFDVRLVGLTQWDDCFTDQKEKHVLKTFLHKKLADFFGDSETCYEICSVRKGDGDVYETDWSWRKNSQEKLKLWIDESRGYAPVRFEICQPRIDPVQPALKNEVEWTKIADVWVPSKFHMCFLTPKREWNLTFVWSSVNKPIDPALFTPDGLKVDHPAMVIDNRLSKPIVTGLTGPRVPAPGEYPPLKNDVNERHSRRGGIYTSIIIVSIIALLGSVLFVRWRMRRST